MNRAYRIPMLTSSMMTPAEMSKGRFMRAPDEPPPSGATGGDSPPVEITHPVMPTGAEM
jgi:hypothetical protein